MPNADTSPVHARALVCLIVSLFACKPEPSGDDEVGGSEGLETDTGSGDTTTESGSEGESSSDVETSADTGETEGGECGNSIVEAGEECDDGNVVDGDGCSAICQWEDGMIPCAGTIYACGDGLDNDRDGLVDLDDPECISPCDDNENSFQTDLPGQNNDCKGDCYFDENSGGGDDHCEWNLQCDSQNPGAQVGCEYDADLQGGMCELEMPPECLEFCVPLVPNGCDCFGCCQIEGQFVYLDSSPDCSLSNLEGCESCTFYENCNNVCEPENCELCFGQDPEDLPDECDEPECPPELQPCLNDAECGEGLFCQTGCCIAVEIE